MEAPPIPTSSIIVDASESDGRVFVFRALNLVCQLPMDVTLKEHFKDGQPYKPEGNGWSQSSTHSGPIDENQNDKWQVTSEHVAGPVGDADSATLEVPVGDGVTAEMLFDAKGQRSNGNSKDDVWQLAAVKKMADRVEVLRTRPHEAGFGRLFLLRVSGRAAFYSPDIKVQLLRNEMPAKPRDGQKIWSESNDS